VVCPWTMPVANSRHRGKDATVYCLNGLGDYGRAGERSMNVMFGAWGFPLATNFVSNKVRVFYYSCPRSPVTVFLEELHGRSEADLNASASPVTCASI
jgi:hypothetical protein